MSERILEHPPLAHTRQGAIWLPLALAVPAAIAAFPWLTPWLRMWVLAAAIYAGFKWATWRQAIGRERQTAACRSTAYLLFWPGMDARSFLDETKTAKRPEAADWAWAWGKAAFGATVLWGLARLASNDLGAGWLGMFGLIFLLHFGLFDVLALFWRNRGIAVQPLMRCPILAASLGDFWGRRWNVAFQNLAFGLMFRPLSRRTGVRGGTMLTFVISGIIHDLVISLPAGGGYGLPTLYFTLQGAGVLLERSDFGTRLGLRNFWLARAFAFAVLLAPVNLLFPPLFVERVVVPFLHVIGALA